MNELTVFDSPEFGKVRVMLINGEPWFVGKDVAEALGYKNTKDALGTHVSDDDKRNIQRSEIATLENHIPKEAFNCNFVSADIPNRGLIVINESGLYSLIFGSKLDSAKKFKKWVTSEVLPAIRKTGSYQAPLTTSDKIMLLAQGHTELKQEVDGIRNDLENLKMDLPILPIEEDRITSAVRRKGTELLGGKDSNAYQDKHIRRKVYANIYVNLKYNFGVTSYKSIKRSQADKAIEIINNYQLPYFLEEQINGANAQQAFAM